jgi:hypothetical protein
MMVMKGDADFLIVDFNDAALVSDEPKQEI